MRRNISAAEARANIDREMARRGSTWGTWGTRSYDALKLAEAKLEFDEMMVRHGNVHMSQAQKKGGKAKHLNRKKTNG